MDVVSADWTQLSRVHFGAASLGDRRRSRRLVKTAELIFKSPAGSLPTRLTKWSDLIGLCRLVNAPQGEHTHARSYVIRSARDRSLDGLDHLGSDRIHHTLHGCARDLPVLGTRQVEAGASTKKGSKARVATVSLAAAPVSISIPKQPRGQCAAASLDLWVIRVAEINPPKNTEPLEWILLTNVPAETIEQISQRVDWYACRPIIEDYHKGQKTGVGIELPQFESAAGMEPVIGILSVVAAALLQLRHNARNPQTGETPATEVVPSLWVKIVAATVCNPTAKKAGIAVEQMSAREFFIGVACLGGYLARKNDGPPGWLTLWRGWSRLHQMIAGANVAMGEKCV